MQINNSNDWSINIACLHISPKFELATTKTLVCIALFDTKMTVCSSLGIIWNAKSANYPAQLNQNYNFTFCSVENLKRDIQLYFLSSVTSSITNDQIGLKW